MHGSKSMMAPSMLRRVTSGSYRTRCLSFRWHPGRSIESFNIVPTTTRSRFGGRATTIVRTIASPFSTITTGTTSTLDDDDQQQQQGQNNNAGDDERIQKHKRIKQQTLELLNNTDLIRQQIHDSEEFWRTIESILEYWAATNLADEDDEECGVIQYAIPLLDRLAFSLPDETANYFGSILETELLNSVLRRWYKYHHQQQRGGGGGRQQRHSRKKNNNNNDKKKYRPTTSSTLSATSIAEKVDAYSSKSLVQPNKETFHILLKGEDDLKMADALLTKLIQVSSEYWKETPLVDTKSVLYLVEKYTNPHNVTLQTMKQAESWLFRLIQDKELSSLSMHPNTILYSIILRGWAQLNQPHRAMKIWDLQYQEYLQHSSTNNNYDDSNTDSTQQQLQQQPDVYTLNTLLNAWSKATTTDLQAQAPKQAQALLDQFQSMGIPPDDYSFVSWIACHANAYGATKAHEMLQELESEYRNGSATMTPGIVAYNTVLKAYAKERNGLAAQRMLEEEMLLLTNNDNDNNYNIPKAPKADETSYNTVLLAWSKTDHGGPPAEQFLQRMIARRNDGAPLPSIQSYNHLLQAWANHQDHQGPKAIPAAERAESIVYEMQQNRALPSPNTISYNIALMAWGNQARRSSYNTSKEAVSRAMQFLSKLLQHHEEWKIIPTDATFRAAWLAIVSSKHTPNDKAKLAQAVWDWMIQYNDQQKERGKRRNVVVPNKNDHKLLKRLFKQEGRSGR